MSGWVGPKKAAPPSIHSALAGTGVLSGEAPAAQHTSGPWAQGATLATRQTDRWSTEELELNQIRERRMVFARFTPIDEGRSRQRIAICDRPEDAARIVQCVNAHDELVTSLRTALEQWNVQFEGEQDNDPWCIAARAAIAKATGSTA